MAAETQTKPHLQPPIPPLMDFTPLLTDDCLLAIFDKVPLQHRLTTVPLVCRRWAQLQPRVRKAVKSVTLLLDAGAYSKQRLRSPFQLEEEQSTIIITERPDLLRLCFTTSSSPNQNVLQAADLPNIHRLTIVQLTSHLPLAVAHLLPLVEQLAGQLTSFSFHYQTPHYWEKGLLDGSAVSAGLQRLLGLVNYRMPLLRHLLLDISFNLNGYTGQAQCFFSGDPGSLYLPVLRQLASFSFHSEYDHIDLLHYSLATFAAGNRRLSLRLELPNHSMSFLPAHERLLALWVWNEPVLQRQLKHLVVTEVKRSCLTALSLPLSRLTSLHLGRLDDDEPRALLFSLFTALSTSLPLLTTLQLDLKFDHGNKGNDRPLVLPPLPSVTSLTVWWWFDRLGPADSFEALLAPARVFPALRRLTVIYEVSYFVTLGDKTAARMPSWVGNSFRLAMLWRALRQSLKLYPLGTLLTIAIELTAGSEYRKVVLGLDDL